MKRDPDFTFLIHVEAPRHSSSRDRAPNAELQQTTCLRGNPDRKLTPASFSWFTPFPVSELSPSLSGVLDGGCLFLNQINSVRGVF